MRQRLRSFACAALAGTTIAAILAMSAAAAPAADDVGIDVFLGVGPAVTRTEGLNFQVIIDLSSAGGVIQRVTVRTALPAGLRWGTDAPDPTEGCTSADPALCTQDLAPNPVGTIGGGWLWDVVAAQPGFYEITASVEPTESDPDLSNNADTFRFEVVQPTSGGGGGGGGGTMAATASAAKLTPAKPKAGSLVTASVRVTAGGSPARPTAVACTGAIGGAKARGTPKAAPGSASCTYRSPRTAKGKTLRGAVTFTARGKRFTKRFSIRLG